MTAAPDKHTVTLSETFTPGEARLELSRVLASPDFAASRQMTSFLRYIVDESLAGRSDCLKERTVAQGALGRPASFDSRLDCVVRVVAGKLRRSLARYYAIEGAGDSLSIEVPKGTYCPVFHRRCVSVRVDNDNNAKSSDLSALDRALPIVAVVPLKLFTGGAKERVWASLMADDVVVRLSRFHGLEVIDCLATSSPYKADDFCRTARRLHANYVFGGTASRFQSHVRLTVRLIDGHSGVLVWGDQFDTEIDRQPSALQQDEIADRIVIGIGDFFHLV